MTLYLTNYKPILIILMASSSLLGMYAMYTAGKHSSHTQLSIFTPPPAQNEIENTVAQIQEEGSSVAHKTVQELDEEHAILLKNLQDAYPLPQEWHTMNQKFEEYKKHDTLLSNAHKVTHTPGNHILVKMARNLLPEYGINPDRVVIYTISEPKSLTNAAAEQAYFKNEVLHRISINIPRLSQRSSDVQEAILRHEIQHLLNYDPLQLSLIDEVLEKNGITHKEYIRTPAYMALNKHKEFRADLTAACKDIAIAQAFKKNFEYNIAQNPALQDDPTYWVTHPSNKQRYAAMDKLAEYLNAEKQAITT